MKTILKLSMSLPLAAAIVLCIAPHYDRSLQSSLYPKPYNETVRRAILKSIRWANDKDILTMVNRAEKKYARQIKEISRKYHASPEDIIAIAIVESSVDEAAKSSEGAIGLMGVKRSTGMAMGFPDIEHPLENLNAGTKYYTAMLKRFKDRELALAAYNIGPENVVNRLSSGFDPETINYIWKIRRVVHVINKSALRPGAIERGI
jgi:soluble lytic murein transglycosylase-like protein